MSAGTSVRVMLLALLLPLGAAAQTPTPAAAPAPASANEPFAILDNSFLVEEAFNQEAGVFQNIYGFQRNGAGWTSAFTQEWPFKSQTHQLSYTLPYPGPTGATRLGDVVLNYRYQATTEARGAAAFSPRLSLILPTGSSESALGLQANFPVSKQRGNVYFHANAGLTWVPRAEAQPLFHGHTSLVTPHVAGSAIYRVRQMFNLMLESVVAFDQSLHANGTKGRQTVFTVSPGARGGWDIGDHQMILGAALPITWVASDASAGVLLYLSYELPFRN